MNVIRQIILLHGVNVYGHYFTLELVSSIVIRLVQQRECSDIHLFSHIFYMFRQKPVGITLLKLTLEILYAVRFF